MFNLLLYRMRNEKSYQLLLAQQLENNGINVILEAPYKHKRIDIVILDDNIIKCIEVKISNFSDLLLQAAKNLIYSDLSFIAIPENNYNLKIHNKAKILSLGIILISNKSKIIHTPKNNPYKIQKFYDYFKQNLLSCTI